MMGATKTTREIETSNSGVWPPDVDLRDARDSRRVEWKGVAEYLAPRGLSLDLELPPRQFAGGLANLNFLLRINGAWMVLRRPPDGPLPPGSHDMRREHRILSRLWQSLPLAPRSYHLCEDASVAGAPFQLLEFRPGAVVRGDDLDPFPATIETGRKLSAVLTKTLAAVHAVDPEKMGLGDLGRPEGFFRRTAQGWLKRADLAMDGQLTPAMRDITHWLLTTADPAPTRATLLHNDFKLDNILLDTRTMSPAAVVDWDMGTRGDALFDVATLLSYWCEPEDPQCVHRLAQMPTKNAGFGTRQATANAYSMLTGRSLADFKPYRVLTMLKLGVVFHQLHRRHRSGETLDPRYATFGTLADELLEFTVDIANDKIF